CFAHVINLSVQAALTQLESKISKLRDLVNRIHSSLCCKRSNIKHEKMIKFNHQM
ncbi:hypothetical protein RhiirA1_481315, partial [Rhizophagus irregularis]